MKILVIHGPNLNLLGTREPEQYGRQTLADINQELMRQAKEQALDLDIFQSNHEGALIDYIQAHARDCNFIIINPAAYTHTSIALRDVLLALALPFIEVHLTDTDKREVYRQHSYFSDIAHKTIKGKGASGYFIALEDAIGYLSKTQK